MAASLMKSFPLGSRSGAIFRTVLNNQTWTRTAFFQRRKDQEEDAELTVVTAAEEELVQSTPSLNHALRKREGLQTVRGYKPPADVESRVQKIVSEVCGDVGDLTDFRFDNSRVKFKILDRAMAEFDHYIPNSALTDMETGRDAVAFFSTPVRDTTAFEDLSKLDLPPNLHIQLDPLRFHPQTDTMFRGLSAFPDRPTVVSSLKYQRKYGREEH